MDLINLAKSFFTFHHCFGEGAKIQDALTKVEDVLLRSLDEVL